jgi:hypothetical protein
MRQSLVAPGFSPARAALKGGARVNAISLRDTRELWSVRRSFAAHDPIFAEFCCDARADQSGGAGPQASDGGFKRSNRTTAKRLQRCGVDRLDSSVTGKVRSIKSQYPADVV